MKIFKLVSAALMLSSSAFCMATAAPPSEVATAIVKFGDLDTTHAVGREQLYRRVNLAARAVCRSLDPNESGAGLQIAARYKACIDQAVAGAVARINRPEVSDYFAARNEASIGSGTHLAAQ